MPEVALTLSGVSKRFGGLAANDGVSLSVNAGEIFALLGENGAGKTTLMNILFGHYVADAGTVEVFGRRLKPGSPGDALASGVGMVQQHFALADNLSVLDNIVAGTEPLLGLRRRRAASREKIRNLAGRCGFSISPESPVSALAVGERQKVEILKALYRDARILILDEPTAVLTPHEAEALFAVLRRLIVGGLAVILISHKLDEVMRVSDRVCVLRRGKIVMEAATSDVDANLVARAMVGADIVRKENSRISPGAILLEAKGAAPAGARAPQSAATFALHEREIIGVAGVSGNGQRELCDMLNGLSPPASGKLEWFGGKIRPTPRDMAATGIARIPDDRNRIGVVGEMTVAENLISNRYSEFCRFGLFQPAKVAEAALHLCDEFDIRCDSPKSETRLLSGGNIQKLILARELRGNPKILIACQPTRGLDVGAVGEIHRALLEAKERGAGVVLVTEDLDELFALTDRIAVMFRGGMSGFYPAESVTLADVGLMMAGGRLRDAA